LASQSVSPPIKLRLSRAPLSCARTMNATAFFIKPYHLNNQAHLYNENILPLVETMQRAIGERRLYSFAAHGMGPTAKVLRHWSEIFATFFAAPRPIEHFFREASSLGGSACWARVTWGLGIKPFWNPKRIAESRRTVHVLRHAVLGGWQLPAPSAARAHVFVHRVNTTERHLSNAHLLDEYLAPLEHYASDLFSNQPLREQLRTFSAASVMVLSWPPDGP